MALIIPPRSTHHYSGNAKPQFWGASRALASRDWQWAWDDAALMVLTDQSNRYYDLLGRDQATHSGTWLNDSRFWGRSIGTNGGTGGSAASAEFKNRHNKWPTFTMSMSFVWTGTSNNIFLTDSGLGSSNGFRIAISGGLLILNVMEISSSGTSITLTSGEPYSLVITFNEIDNLIGIDALNLRTGARLSSSGMFNTQNPGATSGTGGVLQFGSSNFTGGFRIGSAILLKGSYPQNSSKYLELLNDPFGPFRMDQRRFFIFPDAEGGVETPISASATYSFASNIARATSLNRTAGIDWASVVARDASMSRASSYSLSATTTRQGQLSRNALYSWAADATLAAVSLISATASYALNGNVTLQIGKALSSSYSFAATTTRQASLAASSLVSWSATTARQASLSASALYSWIGTATAAVTGAVSTLLFPYQRRQMPIAKPTIWGLSPSAVARKFGQIWQDSGLVLYAPLWEYAGLSAFDLSRGRHTGTLTSGPTWNRPASSIKFTNTSYLSFGTHSDFQFSKGYTFFLTFVADNDSNTSAIRTGIFINNDVCGFAYSHSTASFQQAIYQRNSSGTYVPCQIQGALKGGVRYTVHGKWDGSTLYVYLNGKLNNTASISSIFTDSGLTTFSRNGSGFDGNILAGGISRTAWDDSLISEHGDDPFGPFRMDIRQFIPVTGPTGLFAISVDALLKFAAATTRQAGLVKTAIYSWAADTALLAAVSVVLDALLKFVGTTVRQGQIAKTATYSWTARAIRSASKSLSALYRWASDTTVFYTPGGAVNVIVTATYSFAATVTRASARNFTALYRWSGAAEALYIAANSVTVTATWVLNATMTPAFFRVLTATWTFSNNLVRSIVLDAFTALVVFRSNHNAFFTYIRDAFAGHAGLGLFSRRKKGWKRRHRVWLTRKTPE